MKTLLVILGLVFGFTMVSNAQTQAKPKPQTTKQTTTTTTTTTQPQAPSQTKSMIKITELSKPIQDNLSMQHKGWTPLQAYKLDSKGIITYEVTVKKESNEMRLFYNATGKYLREEPVAAVTTPSNKTSATAPKHTTTAPAQNPTSKPR